MPLARKSFSSSRRAGDDLAVHALVKRSPGIEAGLLGLESLARSGRSR